MQAVGAGAAAGQDSQGVTALPRQEWGEQPGMGTLGATGQTFRVFKYLWRGMGTVPLLSGQLSGWRSPCQSPENQ